MMIMDVIEVCNKHR